MFTSSALTRTMPAPVGGRLSALALAAGIAVVGWLSPVAAQAGGAGAPAACGLLGDGSVGCGPGVVVAMPDLSDGHISQQDMAQAAMLALSMALGPGGASVGASAAAPAPTGPLVSTTADGGFYVVQPAFDTFLASRPTPEQFRARYPQIQLVLPGQPTTMELRYDQSRFFADVGVEGRIFDGRFQ